VQLDPAIEAFSWDDDSAALDIIRSACRKTISESFEDDWTAWCEFTPLWQRNLIVIACGGTGYPFFTGAKTQALRCVLFLVVFTRSSALMPSLRWKQVSGEFFKTAFGSLGYRDKAKYWRPVTMTYRRWLPKGVDPYFEVSRYGRLLAAAKSKLSTTLYDTVMGREPSLAPKFWNNIEQYLEGNATQRGGVNRAPFQTRQYVGRAGVIAQTCIKRFNHWHSIVMGGGFVNTDCRTKRPFVCWVYSDLSASMMVNALLWPCWNTWRPTQK